MTLAKAIADYATVQAWLKALRDQWGEEPNDVPARLETLQRFCDFVERDPDAIIGECSREVESGKRIRIKVRRFYSERIGAFQTSAEGDSRQQAAAANLIRSFMIHNGIFMQAGLNT